MNQEFQNTNNNPEEENQTQIDADEFDTIGEIKVSEGVFEHIAFREALQVDGIASLGGESTGAAGWIRKGAGNKGVRIRNENQVLEIDLAISVEYGRNIREVATELQNRVVSSIETMTGRRPGKVNVHLVSLVDPKPNSKAMSDMTGDIPLLEERPSNEN